MDIAVATGEGEHSSDGWRLPALTGRRAAIARAVYAIVAVLIIVVVAGSFWFNGRDLFVNVPTTAQYGFRTVTDENSIPMIYSVSRREPGRSDLRKGDRILSIDGAPLPAEATEFTIGDRLRADSDGRVTIIAESRDGSRRTHQIERVPVTRATQESSVHLPLWLFIGIIYFSTNVMLLVLLGASLVLALRRPRDPEAMLLALAFLLFCLEGVSTFWLLAFDIVPQPVITLARDFGLSLMVLAVLAFPDGRFTNGFARVGVVAVAGMVALQILNQLIPLPASTLAIAFVPLILCGVGAVWTVFRRTADPIERQQIKWALFGFGGALVLILPIVLLGLARAPLGVRTWFLLTTLVIPLAVAMMPAGVLISLLRYRLYDADTVIGRSAVYSLLTVGFVAVFAASQKVIEILGEDYFGRDVGAIAGGTGAALAAVAIAPMHARVRRWAERRFQRPLYLLRHSLPALVGDLRETAGLRQVAGATLDSVVGGVQAKRAAVLVGDALAGARGISAADAEAWRAGFAPSARPGIDCDNSDPLFPVRVPLEAEGHGRVGWLLLGPRPDGSLFGKSEWDVIEEIAEPVARAIQVTLRRAEREAEIDARLSALEALISARVRTR